MAEMTSIYNADNNPAGILGDGIYPWPRPGSRNRPHPVWTGNHVGRALIGSEHATIFHVAMGDASGHAIALDTDIAVLEALVTRAGGELVDADVLR
jgi:hypothetical protein